VLKILGGELSLDVISPSESALRNFLFSAIFSAHVSIPFKVVCMSELSTRHIEVLKFSTPLRAIANLTGGESSHRALPFGAVSYLGAECCLVGSTQSARMIEVNDRTMWA
jgi:hypothetical protein